MKPAIYPGALTIYQGSVFGITVTYPNRDMTSGTFAMQIRENFDASTTLVSLSTGSGITAALVGSNTEITIAMTATATAALDFDDFKDKTAVFDLEYIPASGAADTERIIQGKVKLSKEVTR